MKGSWSEAEEETGKDKMAAKTYPSTGNTNKILLSWAVSPFCPNSRASPGQFKSQRPNPQRFFILKHFQNLPCIDSRLQRHFLVKRVPGTLPTGNT